jgi:CheY-like chemotaxis protein
MSSIVNEAQPIRVLFVEDEFLISELVAESLSEQGFSVRTASNGTDALRYLASAPVDVLFTDINLAGGMDGTTLARRAREIIARSAGGLRLGAGECARPRDERTAFGFCCEALRS